MTSQDVFIQYLLAQQLISPEHLQKACECQRQQGGDLLSILFDILARHRHQEWFRQSLSQQGLPSAVMQTQSSEYFEAVLEPGEPAMAYPSSQHAVLAAAPQHGGPELKKMMNAFQTVVGVELPPDALQSLVKSYQTVVGVELPQESFQELVRSYDALFAENKPSVTPQPNDWGGTNSISSGARDGLAVTTPSAKPEEFTTEDVINYRYHGDGWAASDVVYTPLIQGIVPERRPEPEPYRIKSYEMLDAVPTAPAKERPNREYSNKPVFAKDRRSHRSEHSLPSAPRIGSALKSLQQDRSVLRGSSRSLQEIHPVPDTHATFHPWKWVVFCVLGLLLFSLVVGGVFHYHTWLTRLLP